MLHTSYPQIDSFIDHLRFEKRSSQHTVISYRTDLEQFFTFLISQYDAPSLPAVTSSYIRSWLAEMRGDDISPKSLNRKISSLKSFFKYHIKLGEVKDNPVRTIISPKMNKRLPTFITEAEMETLQQVTFPPTWKGKTDKLLLGLFYATGMRLSELINLAENQADTGKKQVKVLGKGNKERIIPVSPEMAGKLAAYIAEKKIHLGPTTYPNLFLNEKGKPLYPKYVYNVVQKNLSGVTTLHKKSPHVLRHTFATHLLNNGAPLDAVKDLLGHSSLASTQVYTHNTIGKLKEIHKKAHPKA